MNFLKFRLVVLATALGGAMGMACAQQAGTKAAASTTSRNLRKFIFISPSG